MLSRGTQRVHGKNLTNNVRYLGKGARYDYDVGLCDSLIGSCMSFTLVSDLEWH